MLRGAQDRKRFGDAAPCRNLTSAASKAATWNAPLDTANLHTCNCLKYWRALHSQDLTHRPTVGS